MDGFSVESYILGIPFSYAPVEAVFFGNGTNADFQDIASSFKKNEGTLITIVPNQFTSGIPTSK